MTASRGERGKPRTMKSNEFLWKRPVTNRTLLGYIIRRKRLNRGLSVDGLARCAGYCARTISRIEQFLDTESPNIDAVRDILQALNQEPLCGCDKKIKMER